MVPRRARAGLNRSWAGAIPDGWWGPVRGQRGGHRTWKRRLSGGACHEGFQAALLYGAGSVGDRGGPRRCGRGLAARLRSEEFAHGLYRR
jgi:hypothetical protein